MAEYSRLASGQVTSLGATGSTPVILPFTATYIEILNSSRALAGAGVNMAEWEVDMGMGAAYYERLVGGVPSVNYISSATGGGFSTFQAGISLQYGASLNVSMITAANPAQVTTSTPHGLVSGNVVILQNIYQSAGTGMQQIAGIPFVVTVIDAMNFTIPWNAGQSNYTAYNSGTATVQATVKQILYSSLYYPGLNIISAIALGPSTTVTTTSPNNYVVGQEVAFRIPQNWGTVQLNSLPNVLIPGSPMYGFVTSIVSSTQFVVNINSSSFSAFNSNAPVAIALAGGLSLPQVVAVGDNNSGSLLFGYNSNTINGPALSGAYLNNTSQGFLIGPTISGAAADTIYWRAYLDDYVR